MRALAASNSAKGQAAGAAHAKPVALVSSTASAKTQPVAHNAFPCKRDI